MLIITDRSLTARIWELDRQACLGKVGGQLIADYTPLGTPEPKLIHPGLPATRGAAA